MNEVESKVEQYWERHAVAFESVYTGHKSALGRYLDRTLRRDMFVRYGLTFDHSGPLEGRRVLDIGCGPGHYCVEFARRGAASVVGIDVAENMLALAREEAKQNDVIDRCDFVHSPLEEYHADEPFDVTVAMGFFDYVEEPVPALRHIRAMTRDRLLATFPQKHTWRMPIRKYRLALLGCPCFFYTNRELEEIFRQAGYGSMNIIYSGQIHFVEAHP